jgi:hypothetical protein
MFGLISFIHFHSGRCENVCFCSFPDDVEVVSVYVPPHQARHWNILTTTVKEMDTNWVKIGFTSFLPIFNHMVPSRGHHHVPHLHLSPLLGPIYQFTTSSHLIFTLKMPNTMYNDTLKQLQHTAQLDSEAKGKHCLQNGTGININAEPLLVCRSIFGNGKLHRIIQ